MGEDWRSDQLHSGIVGVTDVQEAIALAVETFKAEKRHAPAGCDGVVRSVSGTGLIQYTLDISDIAAVEWESIAFQIGYVSVVEDAADEWSRFDWHDSLSMSFSDTGIRPE